jgi:hypothetical protein
MFVSPSGAKHSLAPDGVKMKGGKNRSIAFLPPFILTGKESDYLHFISCIL